MIDEKKMITKKGLTVQNASGTQALTLRGFIEPPGVPQRKKNK